MIVLLYYAYHGFAAIFWCSSASQMKQPMKYLSEIVNGCFLKYAVVRGKLLGQSVEFKNGGTLFIGNLTVLNARSPRCDIKYFDEQSTADPKAVDASEPELSVSTLAKIIHGSTPQKGTVFEDNFKRLTKAGLPILSWAWWQVPFMNLSVIKRALEKGPAWWFRQEYEISFEAPQGRVFENVIFGDFSLILSQQQSRAFARKRIHFGLDWNPSFGHYIVGSRWADDYSSNIVLMEKNLGTIIRQKDRTNGQPDVLTTVIKILKQNPGSLLELEDGGTNSGYCEMFFRELDNMYKYGEITREEHRDIEDRVYRRPWDSAGRNKMNSITLLLPRIIYCNEILTPETARWLDIAHWAEDSQEPKLEKDPEQHPLDAYLHSAWVGYEEE